MNFLRALYALAILLMPISYSTKLMFGMPEIVWINPTVLIGLFVFIAILPPIRPQISFYIIISAVISACLGFIFLSPSGGIGSALYEISREPVRMVLNLIWFWLSIYFLKRDREFVVKWLAISVIIQLLMAIYLWFGAFDMTPLPSAMRDYLRVYAMAQIVWFGDIPVIRLAGTFIEGPPFGLFMFSSFVIFSLALYRYRDLKIPIIAGWIASLAGVIGSLSIQILAGLAVFSGIGLFFAFKNLVGKYVRIIGILFMIILIPYLYESLSFRLQETESLQAQDAYAKSGGERFFHTVYGLNLLIDNPQYILFGLGPGRYGAYVEKTGVFRKSATPLVTVVSWLVESGLVGLFLIGWWLWIISRCSWKTYRIFGLAAFIGLLLADMFQGNWLWESWFLALAYIYAINDGEKQKD